MKIRRVLRAFLLALLVIFPAACAGNGPGPDFVPPAGGGRIDGVPVIAQDAYQCGPAALAMILNYYGDPVTSGQIAQAVFRTDIRGTVTLDLMLFARGRGFNARLIDGGPETIRRAVAEGRPLLVMVDYGFANISRNHFMAVVGYAPGGVLVHDGGDEGRLLAWGRFMEPWKRAGLWTLWIEPEKAS